MTKEQIREASQAKLNKVQTFMAELQMVPSAKQVVSNEGVIENVVVFTDAEKYEVDAPEVAETISNKEPELEPEKTTDAE